MSTTTEVITSYKTNNQNPLDAKGWAATLSELKSLGQDSYKAFQYYEGLEIKCVENNTTYVWRKEAVVGEPNGIIEVGGVPTSFTYPGVVGSKLVYVNGIDYSGLTFNLFPKVDVKPSSDIDVENNETLKFADRTVVINEISSEVESLGYKYIKNTFDFTSIPADYNDSIWEIKNFFDLNGATVTLPENVTLKFNGGKFSNGTIVGNKTKIQAGLDLVMDNTVTLSGTFELPEVYPEWFGAKRDGVVDCTTAIQTAINLRQNVFLSAGTYLVSDTINIGRWTSVLKGSGIDNTYIKSDAITGEVIRVQGFANELRNFTIDSTDNRFNNGNSTCFGLRIEPPDQASVEAKFGKTDLIRVTYQPSHGIAFVSGFMGANLTNFRVDKCKGHGIVLDNGTITSRTNLRQIGGVTIQDGVIQDCLGHAILCGTPNQNQNWAYRIKVENVDMFRCALTAGPRLQNTCSYFFAENCDITRCAFNGYTYATGSFPTGIGQGAATISGVTIGGRSINVKNNRFIDMSSYCVRVIDEVSEFTTREINIESFHVSGNNIVNAVINEANILDVNIKNQNYFNFDLLTDNSEIILPDDTACFLRFSGVTRGILLISANQSAKGAAMVHFRCGSAVFVNIMSESGLTFQTTTGALTGTTGANGSFTISAGTDSSFPAMYFENRTAGGANYTIKVLTSNGTVAEELALV